MKKTRALPIDSGDTNMSYANLFGTYNLSLPVVGAPWETSEKALMIYNEGYLKALTSPVYIIPPTYIGTELFGSTGYRKPRYNNLVHTKLCAYDYPLSLQVRRSLSLTTGDYAKFRRSSYWPADGVTGLSASDDYSQYEGAARRAWWTMQPRFEGEVSMLNFLAELRDFRTLAKALWKFDHVKMINDLRARWQSTPRRVRRLLSNNTTIKDVAVKQIKTAWGSTKVLSELRLLKEFAVDPLISDLCTIHQQMLALVRDVQQKFFDAGQQNQTRHYSETFILADSLVDETGSNFFFAKGRFKSTVFTATMEYRYHYNMRETVDAFLRYWGLIPSLEVFWNGTPFTFLVDYFFKIGKAIHTMSVDPRVSLQKVQYCESFNTTHITGRCTSGATENPIFPLRPYRLCVNGVNTAGRRGVPISGYQGSTYVRNVREPNKGAALPKVTLPSNGQTLNALAIARCFL